VADPNAQLPDRIYHVTFASEWRNAQPAAQYTLSTRGARLEDVGYIHASFAHQVERIGSLIFGDATEPLVVLAIDPDRLECPVRVENLEGGTEQFPHIYGPLPTAAVVAVLPARLDGIRVVVEGLDS
jgi:glutathione S-transferase